MKRKHKPQPSARPDAEFAFDLTPDLTGGRTSLWHNRIPSSTDQEEPHQSQRKAADLSGQKGREG